MAEYEEVELTSPKKTHLHAKHIYLQNNSHWKLTGDWKKDSYTTKAVSKIHTESVKKGKKGSGGICVPGRGRRRGGDHMGGDPPWGVKFQATY